MRPGRGLGAGLALLLPLVAAAEADLEYGAYLAQTCAGCHQLHAAPGGVPALGGLDPGYFAAAMHAYQARERPNAIMQSVASGLDAEAIAALAAYFAQK